MCGRVSFIKMVLVRDLLLISVVALCLYLLLVKGSAGRAVGRRRIEWSGSATLNDRLFALLLDIDELESQKERPNCTGT